ncbi:hypothetical protein SmJEL517_g06130 [Synchytrium microbalum]|uniref:Major capsid protein C-terminal domain-containing protein n=1 Tax=Synchytrium microbalum TaxID=1806994 RepID=A0A507BS15_9FUNG|nr:uncharacterized protein SmJEL517_g06130 [Synchytrium microbalum]TPX30278.1 hypothetical protein SmJEL517_g06130 [Synchytrium microbalum]
MEKVQRLDGGGSECGIIVEFRPASQMLITDDSNAPTGGWSSVNLVDATLYIDYIFLDSEERRLFSRNPHEYLIEQLQFTGAESFNNSAIRQTLNFSHPCKELIWVLQLNSAATANNWIDWSDGSGHGPVDGPNGSAKIQLNTSDRISQRGGQYFNQLQPYWHHTRCPKVGIYVYSFALNPEEHQPSGSINMSRIESTTLVLNVTTGTSPLMVYTYARNYNILRIASGMGGLAYAS